MHTTHTKTLKWMAIGLSCAAPLGSAYAEKAPSTEAVINHYADLALAKYTDSHSSALSLKSAIDALISAPSEATLQAARQAWIDARVPYQQTEAYRFGNPSVDAWEGKVNAWPLDEGMIDYVSTDSYGEFSDDNPLYTANVIANEQIEVNGQTLNIPKITQAALSEQLQEADGVEANVATGYHAIEFLLWGQDLNGTGPGAGNRPATDFNPDNCSNQDCNRRVQYLQAATDLLIDDLNEMIVSWSDQGESRQYLLQDGGSQALSTIITGLGSLSYGELAGERMKLGLMLHDPEEEHDCFSDNTHNSHYYNAKGIQNIYHGRYQTLSGDTVTGPSLSDLVASQDPEADAAMQQGLANTLSKMDVIVQRAQAGEAYDQLISEDNAEGNAIVHAAIDAFVDQTRQIEAVAGILDANNLSIEGSDSLDAPEKVSH